MKGSQGIPALHLTTLNKLISKFDKAPNMFFSNLFAEADYPSDSIEWEIEYSSGGMTPFVAPGSVAPAVGIDGISHANAKAAFWKEKMFFDEVFLNNLREPGSYATYQTAQRHLAKGVQKLRYRCDRRKEWMMAQMLTKGTLTYLMQGGTKISVSFGIPESHFLTLDDTRRWDGGASRNAIEDIFDIKTTLADDAGVGIEYAMCNSSVLKTLMLDTSLQALLAKSAFGEGDLFKNPTGVIGSLIGVGNIMVYDQLYEVQGWLTALAGTGGVTMSLDDVSDFEVGGKVRCFVMNQYNTYYDYKIASVDKASGTITVSKINDTDPNPETNLKAGRDKVVMRKKFMDDHTFFMYSTTDGNGQKIAEFMKAPFMVERVWGAYADTKMEWDPDGIWLRIQNKGLPVLYSPDTTFTLTVSSDTPIVES
jgi:hypothetical protein